MAEFDRDQFTGRISARGALKCSRDDRVITGLCGGISELLEGSAKTVRIIAVLLTIFTLGTAIIVYFLLSWMVGTKQSPAA